MSTRRKRRQASEPAARPGCHRLGGHFHGCRNAPRAVLVQPSQGERRSACIERAGIPSSGRRPGVHRPAAYRDPQDHGRSAEEVAAKRSSSRVGSNRHSDVAAVQYQPVLGHDAAAFGVYDQSGLDIPGSDRG